MRSSDQSGLGELAEILAGAFYLFMGVTLLAVVTASAGTALGLLILGACAHVARVGVEGLALRRAAADSDLERRWRGAGHPGRP